MFAAIKFPEALISTEAVMLPVMLKLSLNEIDSFAVPIVWKLLAKTVPTARIFPEAVIWPLKVCVSEIAFPNVEFPVVLIFPISAIPEDKIFKVWVFPALKLISLDPSW